MIAALSYSVSPHLPEHLRERVSPTAEKVASVALVAIGAVGSALLLQSGWVGMSAFVAGLAVAELVGLFIRACYRSEEPAPEVVSTADEPVSDSLSTYFDVDPKLVALITFEGETDKEIIEASLKAALKEKHGLTAPESPIDCYSFEEIPLRHMLILSDGHFYFIDQDSFDFRYLCQQFESKTPLSPDQKLYTAADLKKFENKRQFLGLERAAVSAATTKEGGMDQQQAYRVLNNLALDLGNVRPNGDFELAFAAHAEYLRDERIQNFVLPDLGSQRYGDLNLYQLDMHAFAVFIIRALANAGYRDLEISRNLRMIAASHRIFF